MRIGAIDIGTNSVRLLIAEKGEKRLRRLVERMEVPRLGAGLNEEGILSKEAVKRTIEVLKEYKRLIEEWNALPRVVATSAAREAKNSKVFVEQVNKEVGIKINLITGEEEAVLSYRGAVADLPQAKGEIQLIDIGGGSTELVRGRGEDIISRRSVQLGAVGLKEKEEASFSRQEEMVKEKFEFLSGGFDQLVGVGGTITTLAAVKQELKEYDREQVHGSILAKSDLRELLSRLKDLPLEKREQVPGLSPRRADIIIPGLFILLEILNQLRANQIMVSDSGLLEGIVYKEKE